MTNSKSVQKSQRRKKIHAIEQFGGKCSVCGYDKCINALEFHHTENKKEEPSYIIFRWSWERALKELEKCILVCANCHREIHFQEIDLDYKVHKKVFYEKECKYCKKIFSTSIETQKFCSKICHLYTVKKFDDHKKTRIKIPPKRPTKEELKDLLDKKTSWVSIGRTYGVSDNAVRKWAKKHGLL